jgi:WD40 repeat protein
MADVVLQYSSGTIPRVRSDDGILLTAHPVDTRFTAAAFDASGRRVVVTDSAGAVATFDLVAGRYQLGTPLGAVPSLVQVSHVRNDEVHVVMTDGSVRCINTATGGVVATLTGHQGPIHSISQSSDGLVLLTASTDSAIIWGADDWTRKRSLGAAAGVTCALIVAQPQQLVVGFGDDSVLVYSADDYHVIARLRLPDAEAGAGVHQVRSLSHDTSMLVESPTLPIPVSALIWCRSLRVPTAGCSLQALQTAASTAGTS